MTEAKHTPGPYRCDLSDQGSSGHGAYVAVIGADGNFIAHVMCHDGRLNDLPYKQNATLFTVAPDLLEALKDLSIAADTAELFLREAGYQGMADSIRGHVTKSKRSIAKATDEPLR